MKGVVTLLGFLVSVVLQVSATDYCDPSLCTGGYRSVLCDIKANGYADYGPTPGYEYNACYGRYRIVNSQVVKEIALRQINGVRDQVAAGYHPLLPQASRMPMTDWDDELAKIAEAMVKICPRGDTQGCLNTPTYRNVSSLLYSGGIPRSSGGVNYIEQFKAAMTSWRGTEKFVTAKDVARPTELFLKNSDFTIFINQRATRVGCSINFAYEYNVNYIACVFSTKNVPLRPVYDAGKAGSLCKRGKSLCHTSLCL